MKCKQLLKSGKLFCKNKKPPNQIRGLVQRNYQEIPQVPAAFAQHFEEVIVVMLPSIQPVGKYVKIELRYRGREISMGDAVESNECSQLLSKKSIGNCSSSVLPSQLCEVILESNEEHLGLLIESELLVGNGIGQNVMDYKIGHQAMINKREQSSPLQCQRLQKL